MSSQVEVEVESINLSDSSMSSPLTQSRVGGQVTSNSYLGFNTKAQKRLSALLRGRAILDDQPVIRARIWNRDVDPSTPPITIIALFARCLLFPLPPWPSLAKPSPLELGIHLIAQGVLLQLDVTRTQSFSTCRDRRDGIGRRNLVGRSDRSDTANFRSQGREYQCQ